MSAQSLAESQSVAAAAASRTIEVPPAELRRMLDRALGTLEPEKWPQWCHDIMGGHPDGKGGLVEGVRDEDACAFVIRETAAVPA